MASPLAQASDGDYGSSAVLCVTAGIVATQIAKSIADSPRWVGGWKWAAFIATAVIVISGATYVAEASRLTGAHIASESGRSTATGLTMSAIQWGFLGVGIALEGIIAWAWLVSPPRRS